MRDGAAGRREAMHIVRRLCRGVEGENIYNAPNMHTHIRGEFTNFGRSLVVSTLSLTLPPAVGSLFPKRHPAGRVVSLSLSSVSLLKLPPDSPGYVCLYRTYGTYVRTYIHRSLVTSVTREPLSRIRASPSYGARRRKYINRPHSRRYRQLLLPPSSRLWVNHRRRVCPAC